MHSAGIPHLNHFTFPNLTTFELSTTEENEEFPVSQLLNFLEASPTLRTVHIEIAAETHIEDVPSERVIVLPNAEVFSVTQDKPGYRIAAHVTCPSARLTSLIWVLRRRGDATSIPHLGFMERDRSSVYDEYNRRSRTQDKSYRRRHPIMFPFLLVSWPGHP